MKYYKSLTQSVSQLLVSKDFINGKMEVLEDAFINGFYGALEGSFGINFDKKQFEKYLEETKGKPTDIDALRFIGLTTEKPETYIILNYYLSKFIQIFIKHTSKDKLETVYDILFIEGIEPKFFKEIEEEYQQLMVTKKLASKFTSI